VLLLLRRPHPHRTATLSPTDHLGIPKFQAFSRFRVPMVFRIWEFWKSNKISY